MHIDDNHMYHGAALIQIAEDDRFTAINEMKIGKVKYRDVFRINDDIGIFLKYAGKPSKNRHKEYLFTFDKNDRAEIKSTGEHVKRLFLALVCVKAKQICCMSKDEFWELITRRINAYGSEEEQIQILITANKNEAFHAYVNYPGARGVMAGKKPLIISRNLFPSGIFQEG